MARPKKNLEDTFYDLFMGWALDDQRAALKVLEQLHRQKQRETVRVAQKPRFDDSLHAFEKVGD